MISTTNPQIGNLVLYTIAGGDAVQINRRRSDADAYRKLHPSNHTATAAGHPGRTGFIAHYGNQVQEGQVYPAVVVRDWDEASGTVNLQVLLDGNDTYWATSRLPGYGPGTWCWPPVLVTAEPRTPYIGAPVHYVSYGTPGGEFARSCRAAWITEVTQVEVNEQNPAGDGIYRPAVGLFVANPTGCFFNRGVLFDAGTHLAPLQEFIPGQPLPVIGCEQMTFPGGTWHWVMNAP